MNFEINNLKGIQGKLLYFIYEFQKIKNLINSNCFPHVRNVHTRTRARWNRTIHVRGLSLSFYEVLSSRLVVIETIGYSYKYVVLIPFRRNYLLAKIIHYGMVPALPALKTLSGGFF